MIVRPPDELPAAPLASTRLLKQRLRVIGGRTVSAVNALGQPLNNAFEIGCKVNDNETISYIQLALNSGSLSQVARVTIENKPIPAVRHLNPIRNQSINGSIINQIASFNQGLRTFADFRVLSHLASEDFPCRDSWKLQPVGNNL
jgi:hypothetical protein